MRTLFEWLKLFGAILLLIVLGQLSPVKVLAARIDEHRQFLLLFTAGFTIAGAFALVWGFAVVAGAEGRPMTDE